MDEGDVIFWGLLLFVILFLVGMAFNHNNKVKRASTAKFQSEVDDFLDGLNFSVNTSVSDAELLEMLRPLKDIGRDYPPANEAHSRCFNRLRIARTVIANFDELASSLGMSVSEPMDGVEIGKINSFINSHINFVSGVFSHSDVQAIIWEMFNEIRKQNPEYEPEKSEDAFLDNHQIGDVSINKDNDSVLDVQVIDQETGKVTEVSLDLPKVTIIQPDIDDTSEYDTEDENHDGYIGYIQEGDYWDDDFPNVEFWRRRVDLRLEFDYPSSSGKMNRRTVDTSLYGNINSSSILLKGHCRDKDATRHFAVEKIKHCVDLDKDEQISDVRLYLDNTYNASIHRTLDLLRDEKNDLVTGLLYVARVGGNLTKAKRAAIGDALFWYCEDKRFKEHNLQNFLATFFDTPSTVGFQRLIGRIKRSEDQRMILAMMKGAEGIVKSIKKVKASELEALEYVKGKLG
jgi:hypothetical protein